MKKLKKMNKEQKNYLKFGAAVLALTAVMAGGLYLTEKAKADEKTHPMVTKIAQKFGLSEDEVKAAFEEHRAEKREQRKAEFNERLDQAVADGVITEAQKDALMAKREEMHQEKEENRQENQEKREERREEFKEWAESQGIDLEKLHEDYLDGFRKGGHRGGRF